MDETAPEHKSESALTRIPRSQRASMWGDLRIAWRALIGALKQLPRSRRWNRSRR